MSDFRERLDALSPAILAGLRRGIEKESLRVSKDGTLATTAHSTGLGSALTHENITTDFSEAQLELITGVHTGVDSCLDELQQVHQFVYANIGAELLWCGSMPCSLPDETAIPIARFGRSNVGRLKTVYRTGLAHRYGRRMQTISGLHYNFSLPEAVWPSERLGAPNEAYFSLIRNFRRHAWLLLYLFGASPAVCADFVMGRQHQLDALAPGTLYLPYATSLRMGRLGYMSQAQDSLAVSYNDLATYSASLREALTQPYPPYEAIGIRDGQEYRQLATSLLQIENEFYSAIRPKRVVRSGERPLQALGERGVQYIEVRAMDLDPFAAIGISSETVRFLDVFLLHCLLSDSPPDTPKEIEIMERNRQHVAARGREPGLRLERNGELLNVGEWAGQIVAECRTIASALDAAQGGTAHQGALAAVAATIENPATLPSARVLSEMQQHYEGSHARFTLAHSIQHRNTLESEPLAAAAEFRWARLAEGSLEKQVAIEESDTLPFETYRQQYVAYTLRGGDHSPAQPR
jgi:glutamate--cysteine ligase